MHVQLCPLAVLKRELRDTFLPSCSHTHRVAQNSNRVPPLVFLRNLGEATASLKGALRAAVTMQRLLLRQT